MTNRILICIFLFLNSFVFSQKIPTIVQTLLSGIPINSSGTAISNFVDTSKYFEKTEIDGVETTLLLRPFYYKFRPDTSFIRIGSDIHGTDIQIIYFYMSKTTAKKEFNLIKKKLDKIVKGDTIYSMTDEEQTYFEGYSYSFDEYNTKPELTIQLTDNEKDKTNENSIPFSEIEIFFSKDN